MLFTAMDIAVTVFIAMAMTLVFSPHWMENITSVATYTVGIYFFQFILYLIKKSSGE